MTRLTVLLTAMLTAVVTVAAAGTALARPARRPPGPALNWNGRSFHPGRTTVRS